MYCKYCGKEIADDSKFCQHCGGKLDNNVEVIKGEAPIDKIISKMFSNISKKYLYAYVIWVILNIIFLCFREDQQTAQRWFYPFTYDGFELRYYDFTEFLTYVILIPLLVLYYIQYWHEPLKRKIKSIKSKNGNNATSCHNTEKSKISKLEVVLEKPSEITDNTVNHIEKTEDVRGNQSEGVNDDPSLSLKSDYNQDRIQSERIINVEQENSNETELRQTIDSQSLIGEKMTSDILENGNETDNIVESTTKEEPKLKVESDKVSYGTYLGRRLMGSIIDKVSIFIISIIVILSICVVDYAFPGELGTFSALFHMSKDDVYSAAVGYVMPSYPNDYISQHQLEIDNHFNYLRWIELKIVYLFVIIIIFYHALCEKTFSSSVGKSFFKLQLVSVPYSTIKNISTSKVLLRAFWSFSLLSVIIGLRWLIGFNYYVAIILFFLIKDLPVLFKKNSLLDILTKTKLISVKNELQDEKEKENTPEILDRSR